jgi:hypothetical protein
MVSSNGETVLLSDMPKSYCAASWTIAIIDACRVRDNNEPIPPAFEEHFLFSQGVHYMVLTSSAYGQPAYNGVCTTELLHVSCSRCQAATQQPSTAVLCQPLSKAQLDYSMA